ncbi:MAG: hypothetical protein AAF456_16040 [Planctomycetota bacterium]
MKKPRSRLYISEFNPTGVFVLLVAVAGLLQFFVITAIAMAAYPGDVVPGKYSLTQNFFSDLGMMRSHNGDDNYYASFWFNTALTALGVMLLPLFGILPWAGKRDSMSIWFSAICGIVSGLGLIGLGQLPIDTHYIAHHVALGFWLFPMFAMAMAFFFGAVKTDDMSIWFLVAGLVAVAAMIVLPLVTGTSNHVINQKIIATYGFIWFGFVVWFVARSALVVIRKKDAPPKSLSEQAEDYTTELSRGYRSR